MRFIHVHVSSPQTICSSEVSHHHFNDLVSRQVSPEPIISSDNMVAIIVMGDQNMWNSTQIGIRHIRQSHVCC